MNANETTVTVETRTQSVRNSNGESVVIDRVRVYPCSEAKKLLLLSDDKFTRACKRNRLNLLRKPYAYSIDRPDDVKSWMYGIKGIDLITVANDDRSNPDWELVPTEGSDIIQTEDLLNH